MEKEQNTSKVIVKPDDKGGFLPYLSAFFTGAVTKDFVEDTALSALDIKEKPVLGVKEFFNSVKNFFNKEARNAGLKEIKSELSAKGGKTALGYNFLITFGSFLPGAAAGYFVFKPKNEEITINYEDIKKFAEGTPISHAEHGGKISENIKEQTR